MSHLIEVNTLNAVYNTGGKKSSVLQGINLYVDEGESVGLIGESGSGKSTLAEILLNTLSYKGGEVVCGEALYQGVPLKTPGIGVIGKDIAYIPQDPNTSLDPLCPLVRNFEEIRKQNKQSHLTVTTDRRTVKILEKMGYLVHGIDLISYPHQLSGGMRQRILIALALQTIPKLIIADEPTSNLDVTLERKIIQVLKELKEEQNVSFLITTHNLQLARYFCDRLYVIRDGTIVESGLTEAVFHHPEHEYTQQLIENL